MGNISDEKVKELQLKATDIRKSIVESLTEAGSGHTAGSLGMADIFAYLYFFALKHDPKNPDWPERDIFVLSNGHICPGLYATMAHAGYFRVEELQTLRKLGSRLQGHPHREYLPGIETSSGPLGSGISQAVGMALALRIDEGKTTNRFIYCMVGDGEMDEGQNWEAIMTAAKYRLQNLVLIVDRNNIQIDGYTEDIMPLNDLKEKFESFNWHVQEIDGHNFEMIDDAIGHAKSIFDKPSVIIANTIPGKGVDGFQRRPEWHGKSPSKDEAKNALKELRTLHGQIKCDQLD
ncbi:MAG TPA: transketolase [Candidatus Paceibacterota bacterium]|nr:transketolase [Candidatus Paceibacterota bacterium]